MFSLAIQRDYLTEEVFETFRISVNIVPQDKPGIEDI